MWGSPDKNRKEVTKKKKERKKDYISICLSQSDS
jgi:hypothetical protein